MVRNKLVFPKDKIMELSSALLSSERSRQICFCFFNAGRDVYKRQWQDSGFSAQWQSILCDNHGLKVTAETFWRLPEAGGEVEISLLSIIPYSLYQRFLFQITA